MPQSTAAHRLSRLHLIHLRAGRKREPSRQARRTQSIAQRLASPTPAVLQSLPVPVSLSVQENYAIRTVFAVFALRRTSLHFCSRSCQQAYLCMGCLCSIAKAYPRTCQLPRRRAAGGFVHHMIKAENPLLGRAFTDDEVGAPHCLGLACPYAVQAAAEKLPRASSLIPLATAPVRMRQTQP